MKHRQVRGLRKVELMPHGPFSNNSRLRGRAAEGIRHQRRVHAELEPLARFGTLRDGPWFRYSDTYGSHWCQPDSVLEAHDRILVVESKLSLRRLDTALAQLTKLYRPTLEMFYSLPVVCLVAFRHWLGDAELELVDDPAELVCEPVRSLRRPKGWHLL